MDELRKQDSRKVADHGRSGGSLDVVAMVDEDHFLTGSDSGAISLWNLSKKKPLFTKLHCHGPNSRARVNGNDFVVEDCASDSCNWISALGVLSYSDMFASGSADGYVKLWKISESKTSFTLLNSIPAVSLTNAVRIH
jgi:ribosomal RNA-processing protein 9